MAPDRRSSRASAMVLAMVMVGPSAPYVSAQSPQVAGARPSCLMAPARLRIPIAKDGFMWLKDEAQSGACEAVPAEKWTQKVSGASDLFVYADGPSGSGRYWTAHLGTGRAGSPKPLRGVCFTTSTVGWRTLQKYRDSPLPWLDDLDDDGKAEFILWDSFPLREDATMAEFGLTAWVYRLSAKGSLKLDWKLSRRMARDIAAAYRTSLANPVPIAEPLRAQVAEALERFASEGCSQPREFVP